MLQTHFNMRRIGILLALLTLFALAACQSAPETPAEPAEPTAETDSVAALIETVPATWTVVPAIDEEALEDEDPTAPAPATSTTVPTSTAVPPTNTPKPSPTATPSPTAVPQPTAPPAVPTDPPPPAEPAQLGVNLLPNGSFEENHYNQNGVPELQLPVGWRIEWDEGPTGLGNEAWDVYVRPEARVLTTAFLPPEEHNLYIYNGQKTVKIFKGSGAVSFRLLTDVTLEPGTYVIEAKMFADIVDHWEKNVGKVWAADPTAAEFRFLIGDGGTVWTGQNFGQINVHNFTFTLDEPKTIKVGIWLRGKYAIGNNGWFIDDLSLRRVE